MRVALISDIHGNLVSLEAVLADIDREGVDQIVCLGDVAGLGPQPREILARLQALGCICIMGNHDSDLLNPDCDPEPDLWTTQVTAWCADQLSKADLDYIRSFQPLVEISLGGRATLLCYHGSPRSNTDRILSTTPSEKLDEMLAGHTATVMVGGHNHVQMLRWHRGAAIVDVGSVGLPFDQMPFEDLPAFVPWAEYGIVSWVDGVLNVDLRQVPIDLYAVKQAALASDMPGTDYWVNSWLALE
jgi:predicted phosphodiesterase